MTFSLLIANASLYRKVLMHQPSLTSFPYRSAIPTQSNEQGSTICYENMKRPLEDSPAFLVASGAVPALASMLEISSCTLLVSSSHFLVSKCLSAIP